MSHISTWKAKIKDFKILQETCTALNYEFRFIEENENIRMYGLQKLKGVAVLELPDWRYPIVINKDGTIHYDNWGSPPSSMQTFGKLLQKYNENVIKNAIDFSEWDNVETTVNETDSVCIELTVY